MRQASGTTPVNDFEVLKQIGATCPAGLLKLGRLMLFVRVLKKQPEQLMPVLFYLSTLNGSWMRNVHADLQLFAEFPELTACAEWTFQQWQ